MNDGDDEVVEPRLGQFEVVFTSEVRDLTVQCWVSVGLRVRRHGLLRSLQAFEYSNEGALVCGCKPGLV